MASYYFLEQWILWQSQSCPDIWNNRYKFASA